MASTRRRGAPVKRAPDEAESDRQQLERANEAIRVLVEEAPDGIFVADFSGRYTDVNAAGCRMLGYTREEILGKTVMDLLPAEDLPRLSFNGDGFRGWDPGQRVESPPQGRRPRARRAEREDSRRRSLAGLRPGHHPAQGAGGGARGQAGEDLVRAQSVAKVGSWRLDFRRNELRWSEETHRIYGLAEAPQTYEAFLACVHPDDSGGPLDPAWTAAFAGQPYDIEHRVLVDGVVKWVRSKADLELDEHHALVSCIGITDDITDRKLHEEERRRGPRANRRSCPRWARFSRPRWSSGPS